MRCPNRKYGGPVPSSRKRLSVRGESASRAAALRAERNIAVSSGGEARLLRGDPSSSVPEAEVRLVPCIQLRTRSTVRSRGDTPLLSLLTNVLSPKASSPSL